MKNAAIHEGKLLNAWLKNNGYTMTEVWQKLGYTGRQNLNAHLSKAKLSELFKADMRKKLKLDVDNILGNKDDILIHTLSSDMNSAYFDGKINTMYFHKYLPTNDDTKGWTPVFSNFADVVRQFNDITKLKAPLFDLVTDDYERSAYAPADCTCILTSDNMGDEIPKGATISMKYTPLDRVRYGKIYMFVFDDRTFDIYRLMKSDKPGYMRLQSKYPDNEIPTAAVVAMFQVIRHGAEH